MKKLIMTIAIVAISSSTAFAEKDRGGGNIEDIAQQTKGKTPPVVTEDLDKLAKQAEEERKWQYEQQEGGRIVAELFNNHGDIMMAILTVFQKSGYPLALNKKITAEKVKKTLELISGGRGASNFPRISVDNNLSINNSPVTFISYPAQQRIVFNRNLYEKQIAEGKVDIFDLFGIILHEMLVLNEIETTKSYPYTNEFVIAARAANHPGFKQWLKQFNPKFTDCESEQKDYALLANVTLDGVQLMQDEKLEPMNFFLSLGRCFSRLEARKAVKKNERYLRSIGVLKD